MQTDKQVNKAKSALRQAWGVFLDWVHITLLLTGALGVLMMGAVCISSMANGWRMTGYLDVLFGFYTIGTFYILFWLPVAALVYYNRYE
jgi:hypothetical protein